MIKVTNSSRRAQVYNLPHDVMCVGKCTCTKHEHRQTDANPATGDVGTRVLERMLSGSVHLQPSCSAFLDDVAEKAPEIASARARGEIQIAKVETPKSSPAQA